MEIDPPPPRQLEAFTANARTAAFIRGKMAEQRKTATDLGQVLEISRQAASRRISGAVTLSLDDLELIAFWLELPLRDIVQPGIHEDHH